MPLWTNRYDGLGNGADRANAVAVDGSGTVFVSGESGGNGTSQDYTTIAYDSGGVPLWTNLYNGPGNGNDVALGMDLDGTGSVLVTGISRGSGGNYDCATIAYNSGGLPLWTNLYNGPGNGIDGADAVAVTESGNVLVTGLSQVIGTDFDYVTIAYNSNGVPLWTNPYNGLGNGNADASAVAVDGNGSVFVTGHSYGNGTGSDYATIAYDSSGMPLWTNRYDGPAVAIYGSYNHDKAVAVAVDASGTVFVSGNSRGSGGSIDYATIAYNSDGTSLWTNRYNGPVNGNDQPGAQQSLAIAPDGVMVVGYSDLAPAPNVEARAWAVVKYTNDPLFSEPVISRQPQSVTNVTGSSASFSINASGQPEPALQWRFNGNPIPYATHSTYSITSVVFADAGDYDVVVTNIAGSVTSSAANLTVVEYGKILNQLASETEMVFTFGGQAGADYALEQTFSLNPPVSWTHIVTNRAGINGSLTLTNSAVPGTNNFWRIRSVP